MWYIKDNSHKSDHDKDILQLFDLANNLRCILVWKKQVVIAETGINFESSYCSTCHCIPLTKSLTNKTI